MGWKGMLIGSYLGGFVGHLPGSLIGAFVGHKIEERFFAKRYKRTRPTSRPYNPAASAYSILGAKATDDAETLKRRYRELAKRNHPDALRARGASEAEIRKATDRMSRINEAWSTIQSLKGI